MRSASWSRGLGPSGNPAGGAGGASGGGGVWGGLGGGAGGTAAVGTGATLAAYAELATVRLARRWRKPAEQQAAVNFLLAVGPPGTPHAPDQAFGLIVAYWWP
jgi:hypothetical protein